MISPHNTNIWTATPVVSCLGITNFLGDTLETPRCAIMFAAGASYNKITFRIGEALVLSASDASGVTVARSIRAAWSDENRWRRARTRHREGTARL